MSSQPDLEFTKDSEWNNQRERYWKPLETDLKENNRSAKVAQFKQLYMTGTCDDIPTLRNAERSGAIVIYYPLQTAEGWDFAFQNEYLKPDLFKKFFYDSLENTYINWMPSEEVQLRFFDYFHPEIYQHVVKSRVPIGRDQKIIELEVDLCDLLGRQLSNLIMYVNDDYYTPVIDRRAYFFSCLDKVGDVGPHAEEPAPKCGRIIKRLLKARVQLLGQKVGEKEDKKLEFLDELYSHIANKPVDPSIKKIWQEVVAEYE
ncbi:hypothetical protein ACJJI4_11325 [Microbulbifer sp. TRSA002]|uniref:hypothetical protein n=1 Tax=Microbulbifer sp. TRSA002 TaxID=3243382 RepID=UPI00403A61AB